MNKRWPLVDRTFTRHSLLGLIFLVGASILGIARPATAQDWFKTGTGMGVTKARLALPDTAARSTFAQPLPKTFHDVVWGDLDYSGIVDMVSPSFYPVAVPGQPSVLKPQDWAAGPANAYVVEYGNL